MNFSKRKHRIIPVFIPELGCPHKCVFCNQKRITGIARMPEPEEIHNLITERLHTFPADAYKEIAFFGGNFTGIDVQLMTEYLTIAKKYKDQNIISSIRISTRPDYIDSHKLDICKQNGVETIELGVQSMNDNVLAKSGRGHTSADVRAAVSLIRARSFRLGLQLMTGLPNDTFQTFAQTVNEIVALKPDETRIYPLLVIPETSVFEQYQKGQYKPLTLEEAVKQCVYAVKAFEFRNIHILRIGLHPSKDFGNPETNIVGPWHPSFSQLVYTEVWREILKHYFSDGVNNPIEIQVSPTQFPNVIGYQRKNLLTFKNKAVKIVPNTHLSKLQYAVYHR